MKSGKNTFKLSRSQWISVAVLASSLGLAVAVTVPNTFTAGTPASATQVNDNFTALVTAVTAAETALSAAQTQITALESAKPRIAFSAVGGFPTLIDAQTLASVSLTVTGSAQLVYLSGQASTFTNSLQAAACSSAFCNVGIEIFDADTDTRLTPLNGSFYRLTTNNHGASLSISVVVSAPVGTHNYRLQTELGSVNAGVLFLNNASLTAMTVPLNGDGSAP